MILKRPWFLRARRHPRLYAYNTRQRVAVGGQADYAVDAHVARRHERPSRVADDGRWKHPKCDIDGDWYEVIGERRWTLGRRQTRLLGGTGVLERDRLR